jgi:hypothetical protein
MALREMKGITHHSPIPAEKKTFDRPDELNPKQLAPEQNLGKNNSLTWR